MYNRERTPCVIHTYLWTEANVVNDPSDLKFETLILNSGREAKQDKPCWELQIAVKSGSKDKPCWELQMDIADISLEMEKVGEAM